MTANDVIAQHGPFDLIATGAIATREVSVREWLDALAWCRQVERASPFWIGDLLAYGERQYGETYTQALDATEYAYGTLANAMYVAKHVAPSRRRENLTFSHHQEVAALPPAEQDHWLARAEAEGFTVRQLRERVRTRATGPPELWLRVRCTDFDDQSALADRLRLEGRVVKVTATPS